MSWARYRRTSRGNTEGKLRVRLTPENVRAIRAALAAGAKQVDLARRYGVTKGHISHIATGRTWKCAALAAGEEADRAR
jgi:RimJ/RimL family protein N-acetyltransferase